MAGGLIWVGRNEEEKQVVQRGCLASPVQQGKSASGSGTPAVSANAFKSPDGLYGAAAPEDSSVLSVLTLLPIDVTFAIADIDDSAVPNDSACTSVLCARESHRAAPEAVGTASGKGHADVAGRRTSQQS